MRTNKSTHNALWPLPHSTHFFLSHLVQHSGPVEFAVFLSHLLSVYLALAHFPLFHTWLLSFSAQPAIICFSFSILHACKNWTKEFLLLEYPLCTIVTPFFSQWSWTYCLAHHCSFFKGKTNVVFFFASPETVAILGTYWLLNKSICYQIFGPCNSFFI